MQPVSEFGEVVCVMMLLPSLRKYVRSVVAKVVGHDVCGGTIVFVIKVPRQPMPFCPCDKDGGEASLEQDAVKNFPQVSILLKAER